ncbi:DAGKc domain-containing protein [Sphingomonas antarctica]|uniref:diacylglycerol/lipid kinase family protein n=1 Tax=Sphingomonas antarctica TaxID=2040274 RepID=UPI0039EB08FD
MTATLPVIVNAGGGAAAKAGDKLETQLAEAFAKAGIDAEIMLVRGEEISATLDRVLKSHGRVAIGGGDGTIGSAALAVSEAGATMGVLPLGTRNHLARQLGVGPELDKAVAAIAAGRTREIDIGRIADRGFVNNVSIGLYPKVVRLRDDAPLPKAIANFPAAWTSLKRLRHHRLRVIADGTAETIRTPMLFIGNNVYSLEPGSLGQRENLEGGKLGVYAVAAKSRLGLIGFAISALRGRIDYERDFAQLTACRTLEINAHAGSLDVAIDGEPVRLPTPIKLEIVPRALKVFAP